jgi:hypothetical protein
MESDLRQEFFDVDGNELYFSRCGGETLQVRADASFYRFTATEAARLRDWLNEALGDSGCDFTAEKTKTLYDDMLAGIRKLGAARPEVTARMAAAGAAYLLQTDWFERDAMTAQDAATEIYQAMAVKRRLLDDAECDIDCPGCAYCPDDALEAEYPSADIFCDCDDVEPDVDMMALRKWAVEQSGGMHCTEEGIENAERLVDYVLNGPSA